MEGPNGKGARVRVIGGEAASAFHAVRRTENLAQAAGLPAVDASSVNEFMGVQ